MFQEIFLFIATFIAYFTKGITGFGNTLVMGSLFSFMISNKITTPVDLLISIPTNVYMVYRERKHIKVTIVLPLSLMLLAGVIPGTLLLKVGNDWVLKSALGIVVVGIGIEMFTRKENKKVKSKKNSIFLVVVGVISGILAGAYGIGALLVAYISRTTSNKWEFRANICCIFLVDNFFRFFLYWYMGILNTSIVTFTAHLIPAVIIGLFLGIKIDSKMNEKTTKTTVITLLVISGVVLLIKSTFFH